MIFLFIEEYKKDKPNFIIDMFIQLGFLMYFVLKMCPNLDF